VTDVRGILLAFRVQIALDGGMPRRRPPKPSPPPLTVAEVLTWADAPRAHWAIAEE
jgi:hypothetical protein